MYDINRIAPDSTAKTVFTKTEMRLLDHLVPVKSKSHKKTIKKYLTLVAKLGGYLNRSHDPPPRQYGRVARIPEVN